MKKTITCATTSLLLIGILTLQTLAINFKSEENIDNLVFPFIYSDADDLVWVRKYVGDCSTCIEGRLYVKDMVTGEVKEIVSDAVKQLRESEDTLYCITNDGLSIIQTDCQGKKVTEIYKADYGMIDHLEVYGNNLCFTEGDYVVSFDLKKSEKTVVGRGANLVLAAIGTSGGALNLLAQMLINQANQYEADQRISFFRRHPDIDTFVQQHAAPYGWPLNDNYALAYRVLQSVCGIQRGSQPYSHMKKAELVLKGYVSESSSTQLTSLNIAINGGLAMGHYWKGRLLLEQAKQDHDRCNDYKDAAIASFCATNVTERFDHLPENADEDAAPQLSPPQWLSAIELLRYPDREVFRVDRRMVFQTIYQKLTQQVEEVQSDNIQIHNERYRLTKKDVRSNLERCLDMVKARFPDKEPLIQEMIRSIR